MINLIVFFCFKWILYLQMRSARRRGVGPVRRSVQPTQPVSKPVDTPVKKDRHASKMEEEPLPKQSSREERERHDKHEKRLKKHSVDEMESDSDEDDTTSDIEMDMEQEHEELKQEVAPQTLSKLRPNEDLYIAIKERYQELIKELWQSQNALEEFNFSEEEKQILRDRVKLWLEYFISTATFRDENVNLFEYMDTFWEKEHFI